MRLLRMVGAEWRKVQGRGLVWAVLIFGMLHGAFGVAVLYTMGAAADQSQPGTSDSLDWILAADVSVGLASYPINGLILLVLFAILWAEDLSIGTAAMILVRPVRRAEVFLAKAILGTGVSFASIALAGMSGSIIGLIVLGTGGDTAPMLFPTLEWMNEVESDVGKLLRIGYGTVLATVLMLPALAFAALFASLTKSPLLTLAGTVLALVADAGSTAILWALGRTDLAAAETANTVREWTLWASRDLYEHHGPLTLWAEGAGDLGRTLGYSAGLLLLAALVFQRRDIR